MKSAETIQLDPLVQRILRLTQTGIWTWHIPTESATWSPQTYRLFDIPEGQPVTRQGMLTRVHPDDRESVMQAQVQAIAQGSYEFEYRVQHTNGRTLWLQSSAGLTRDSEGNPLEMYGVVTDITDRKLAQEAERLFLQGELQKTEEILQETARLAAIGEASASLAHELKTPLSTLLVQLQNMEVLQQLNRLDSVQLQEKLSAMKEVAKHLQQRLQQMQNLARRGPIEKEFCTLKDILKGLEILIGPSLLREGIQLTLDVPCDLPTFYGNRSQIEQVLIVLCNNARDALRGKAQPQLVLSASVLDSQMQICLRDNGIGMNEEVKAQLFTPFFTTKERGKGTGLGLSIARRIIDEHQGTLTVESKPGQGSTFFVVLPLMSEETPVS